MSSGRDEWMSNWSEDDRQRNLGSYLGQVPEEFGGPAKGVTGKHYEQLELDLGYAGQSDEEFEASVKKHEKDFWMLKHNVNSHILQANAIIKTVMDSIGSSGGTTDDHEFALWGASELLQKASSMLE